MTFNHIIIAIPAPVATEIKQGEKELSLFEKYTQHIKDLTVMYGPRIIIGLIVLIIGWWLIRMFVKAINRIMLARDIDPTLRPFLKSLISISLKVMLLISVASQIGIQTTSFMAALGAAGLAIGLALQGSLANFAGGILILVFKPFKAGDYIGTQKYEGQVSEIQILYTILNTSDNKKVVIPNGLLSNNEIVNFSANDNRRVDLKFKINFDSDLNRAKEILEEVVSANPMIFTDPAPVIGVNDLTESAIEFVCWIWVKRDDYLAVKHQVQEMAKKAFDAAGIKLASRNIELQLSANTRL